MCEKIKFNFAGQTYEVNSDELFCGLTSILGRRNCLKFAQAEGFENLVDLKNQAEVHYPSRSALDTDRVHMVRSEWMATHILRVARKLQRRRG